jgi:cation diffusion facilitator CzcD-associated flavoprotein CzcO
VLVVGAGSSALEIVHDVATGGSAAAWLARRIDIGDLAEFGLPVPAEGVFARGKRLGRAPAIVDREVIQAIRHRRFTVVQTIEAFDGNRVRLVDGRHLDVDVVICATGYLRGLEPMVGHLGVLDERGLPRATGAVAAAPGLRFIRYLSRPGLISFVARQSERVAKRIIEEPGQPSLPHEVRVTFIGNDGRRQLA